MIHAITTVKMEETYPDLNERYAGNDCVKEIWSLQIKLWHVYPFFQVARHLAKLFDSMAHLKFEMKGEKATKEAVGMYSKDGEYVDFDKSCMCEGQVWV